MSELSWFGHDPKVLKPAPDLPNPGETFARECVRAFLRPKYRMRFAGGVRRELAQHTTVEDNGTGLPPTPT